ncbi:MAG: hypothetical protein ACPG8W_21395 [Candidatus Promineifilaceae bacterium]
MIDVWSKDNEQMAVKLLRDSLAAGKQARLTILSGSMTPMLRKDEQAIVVACAVDELEEGDIVVISAHPHPYTHRYCATITHEGQQYVITRGDRPLIYDPAWETERFIGRVIAIEKAERRIDLMSAAGKRLNQRFAQLLKLEERAIGNHQVDLTSLIGVGFHERDSPPNKVAMRVWRSLFYLYYRLA